ncbi:hypothetical protein EKO27_g12029 [Xylaria grammica]|uniref:Uncharacterized protein n=1 Tax=Xylaria grammica TaxID=363999 RepID=A0A439CLN3_9PEZI|nr:hypothetical protein EKO27_g12029 [Xylaria grammica]
MANDRDSQKYQDDYQRGLDRINDVRRKQRESRVTQSSGGSDGSEPSNGSTHLHSPLVPLPPSAPTPTPTPATTTAANDKDRRYTEDYLQAQAAIEAHRKSISSSSNTGASDRNCPAATATPTPHHSPANGGAGARARAREEEEEEDRSRLPNLELFNHDDDDDGIRHRNPHRNPASHRDQGEAPPHPPTAQPTQTHANPPSRGDLASRLSTLLYTVCLGNRKRMAATLLLAVSLLGPHHIPVFGFLIAPLSRAGLSLLSWCLHTLVVDRLLRAAGVGPSVAVCDSRSYDGGGRPNGTTLVQARQDLIADYESLITVL